MALPYDIPWIHAFWADAPGFADPADGAAIPSTPNDFGSAAASAAPSGAWDFVGTPTWVTDLGGSGKAAIDLTGPAGLRKTSGVATVSGKRTAVVVGRVKGTGDADLFDTTNARSLVDTSGGNWRLFAGSLLSGAPADTDTHLFVAEFDTAGTDSLEIDGASALSGDAGSNPGDTSVYVGNTPAGSGNVDGVQIAFVGYLDRALTAQERTDLNSWYLAEYVSGDAFGAPTITGTAPDLTEIEVQWAPVPDAAGYRLFVDGVEDTGAGLITGTSYTKTGLTQGTVYSFEVLAEKADTTQSAKSSSVTERASRLYTATTTTVVSEDDPNSSAFVETGLTIPGLPAYLAYRHNQRRSGSDFWWYEQSAAPRAPVYGYMGKWADGLTIEKVSGDTVRIIEWERGSQSWRETDLVNAGDTHTIDLSNVTMTSGSGVMEGEACDNVLVEHAAGPSTPWTVRVWNWNPAPIPVDRLTLTPGDGTIRADWESDWTDFEVRLDAGPWIAKGSAKTHTFTELTNGAPHTVEVRMATPIGAGPAIRAVGSSRAGFHVRDIPWDSILWASEAGIPSNVTDGETLKVRPRDTGEAGWQGIPGGTWEPRLANLTTWRDTFGGAGRPAFRFDGGGARLQRKPAAAQTGGTIVTVGRIVSGAADLHDAMPGGVDRLALDNDAGKWRIFTGDSSQYSAADADTEPHLFVLSVDPSGNETLKVDGATVIDADSGTSGLASGLAFGTASGVSEVAFGATIGRALTAQEESDLLAWVQSEYLSGPAEGTFAAGSVSASGSFSGARDSEGTFAGTVSASGSFSGGGVSEGTFAAGSVSVVGSFSGTSPEVDVPEGTFAGSVSVVGDFSGSRAAGGTFAGETSVAGSLSGPVRAVVGVARLLRTLPTFTLNRP